MKIEHITAVKALNEQREAAMSRHARLAEEPLRLVLGKGSGEIEVKLTDRMLAEIKRAALDSVHREIADLEHRLRSYGVALPDDTPPSPAPPYAAARAAS